MSKNIGVYSGTFDPPHAGHRAFVSAAIEQCGLDRVYVLPDPSPLGKHGVTSIAYRTNMARLMFDQPACRVERVGGTSIRLGSLVKKVKLPEQFYLLLGSDAVLHLAQWDDIDAIIERATFVIGLRQGCDIERLTSYLDEMAIPLSRRVLLKTDYADYGSTHARSGQIEIHKKIAEYVQQHGLYTV